MKKIQKMLLNGVMILSNIGKQHTIVNAGYVPQKSPGLGNTGVIKPNEEDFSVNISFDWFKFTTDKILFEPDIFTPYWNRVLVKGIHDDLLLSIVNILNNDSRHYTEYELYNGSFNHSGCRFGFDINEGIKAGLNGAKTNNFRPISCFELTGKGCYEFSKDKNYISTWLRLFDLIVVENMTATRLDIAFDFIGGERVDEFIKFLIQKIKAGDVRTKWKDNFDNEVISKNGGYTIYLGSPTSSSRIRIYNKNAEKVSKDKNAFITADNFWRLELQLNDDKTHQVNNFIKNFIVCFRLLDCNSEDRFRKFIFSFLNEYFEVRDRTDERISRCPINKKWSDFIENSMNFYYSFGIEKDKRRTSMEIKRDWLLNSVSKVLFQTYFCFGENIICDLITSKLSLLLLIIFIITF